MKQRLKKLYTLCVILMLLFQCACSKTAQKKGNTTDTTSKDSNSTTENKADQSNNDISIPETTTTPEATNTPETVEEAESNTNDSEKESTLPNPYDDVRGESDEQKVMSEEEYVVDDIYTYSFDSDVIFEGNEELQANIMEQGKNPGLGIRKLHEEGITGKGVNVAIIDQNLFLNHPEFDGKIVEYYDTGCNESRGSMHGPAVTSLLVGDTIGVAPDARVYYAATPTWLNDSEYYANGLYWIIEENKKLPEESKIRVVSVSAAPSGDGSPFEKNTQMWDEAVKAAEDEGILVLDCRENEETSIIAAAFYDRENPEEISLCNGGYPISPRAVLDGKIAVPTSYRTVANEYIEGKPIYLYSGQGGLSWGIPYAAGVLALGWQVNPNLTSKQIVKLLQDTCSAGDDYTKMINPTAFIEAVKNTK